jgi:hypothetical protein
MQSPTIFQSGSASCRDYANRNPNHPCKFTHFLFFCAEESYLLACIVFQNGWNNFKQIHKVAMRSNLDERAILIVKEPIEDFEQPPDLVSKKKQNRTIWTGMEHLRVSIVKRSKLHYRLLVKYFDRRIPDWLQDKLLFAISNILGSGLFLLLFQFVYSWSVLRFSSKDKAFSASYAISYFASIFWQHMLNQCLTSDSSSIANASSPQRPSYIELSLCCCSSFTIRLFNPPAFCVSLARSYLVYCTTLLLCSVLGSIFVGLFHLTASTTTILMLPLGGALNYFMLRSSSGKKPTSGSAFGLAHSAALK